VVEHIPQAKVNCLHGEIKTKPPLPLVDPRQKAPVTPQPLGQGNWNFDGLFALHIFRTNRILPIGQAIYCHFDKNMVKTNALN
jgi:hypothetical protein